MNIEIKLLPGGKLPQYMSVDAAGMDCYANDAGVLYPPTSNSLTGSVDISRVRVSLGFAIAIPKGYVGLINPRSGLGLRYAVLAGTGARVIDSDYRGEVSALLFNLGKEVFRWNAGERIAQIVISPVVRAVLVETADLDATARGERGFGSSGK